ncbi:glutamine--tRNA ligase/YqeY domain fusion protein [Anaerotalea alkaliphila]|nr:glutamine--tRNA ligase/YqeY domain fusion protein [Anaerotalea alkaliphila]
MESKNFIEHIIDADLAKGTCKEVVTRFPPEPNGFLHIGHAKAITTNAVIAEKYNGKFNLRFDDTDPSKEKSEYVEAIKEDVAWLGADYDGRVYYASGYFDQLYEKALELIRRGKAFVCDLNAEEMREYRGTLTEPGKESPYRQRSIEENLDLFQRMKDGEFPDGAKVLRAKIDMASPNMNMRDPAIYRIAHLHHYATGDKWCVYPLYDFAHPIEDALEGVTHSLCGLEFEDHRPLYNWVLEALEWPNPPKQIEFAELDLSNTILGKRRIRPLVESGIIDGWDDPRLATIKGLRRRGYTKEAIRGFFGMIGLSKSKSRVDIAMLEHALREDLKMKVPRIMVVSNPLKVVVTNWEEDRVEYLESPKNLENEDLGTRLVPFTREIYIDREDFMEVPEKKYKRLSPGVEVRLMNAYFVTCNEVVKDADGQVVELRCTYDPATRSGSGFKERKPKGTIHWVSATLHKEAELRLFGHLFLEDGNGEPQYNEKSKVVIPRAYVEMAVEDAQPEDKFQFVRNGYFCVDNKDSTPERLVFNLAVSLKSSY